jgi:hypothetical protein
MIEVFNHIFVEFIPKELDEGTLYVSMEHAVAVHLCACGCGSKVVTPLSPINWQLLFDGRAISLTPSIGNHAFACRSHYWIQRNRARWSWTMSPEEVEDVRAKDRRTRERFYGQGNSDRPPAPSPAPQISGLNVIEAGGRGISRWRTKLHRLSASLASKLTSRL